MSGPLRLGDDGRYRTAYTTCTECGGQYLSRESHLQGERHRQWLKGEMEVEVPKQPDALLYTEKPDRIVFGETVICPRCRGMYPPQTKRRILAGKPPPERFTREPGHPEMPCRRCNGHGYVPNVAV